MERGTREQKEWAATYRRLRRRQITLEEEIMARKRLQGETPEDEERSKEKDEELEEKERRLTFELNLLQIDLLDEKGTEESAYRRWTQRLLMTTAESDVDLARAASLCGRSEHELRKHLDWLRESKKEREIQRKAVLCWKEGLSTKQTTSSVVMEEKKKTRSVSEETRRRIVAWKEEKDRQKMEIEMDRKVTEERRLREERMMAKMRRTERRRVSMKRNLQEVEKDRRMERNVIDRLRRLSLARLRERDQETAHKRQQTLQRTRQNATPLQPSTNYLQVPRDPQRLHQATKVWMARINDSKVRESGSRDLLYVLHTQKLAIPSWRK